MWQTFWAILYKDLRLLIRNKNLLRAVITLQVMDVMVVGWLDLTVRNMPLVVVDQDRTASSRELIQQLEATKTFALKYITSSTEQARGHIRAGRAKAAVVIPPDYARAKAAGDSAQVLALVDGSDAMSAAQATAALDGVAVQMNVESATEPVAGIEARPILLFNPQGSASLFMLPGLLALLLANLYSSRALSLSTEREEGNLERLLMSPMNYTGLILGKIVPYAGVVVLNGIIYLLVMRWLLGVPVRGSIPLLLFGLSLYAMTFLSLGVLVSAGAKTQMDAFATHQLLTFPATMLSGYLFPLASLPKVMLPISYALPETHFIALMRAICIRGSTFRDLLPHFAYLLVAPAIFLIWAGKRFQRSVID